MLRRLVLPYFLSQFMCTVLRQMHYRIRLPQGQLATYDGTNKTLYGTGQGARCPPPCWAVNSDIISCCMEQYSRGTMLVHPNNTIISHRHLDVFVDDTSLGITSEAMKRLPQIPDSPVLRSHDIRLQLQHNMAFYNCLLNLTGGALAWKKCKAYILARLHSTINDDNWALAEKRHGGYNIRHSNGYITTTSRNFYTHIRDSF